MPDQYRRSYWDQRRRAGRRGWTDRSGEEMRSWLGDDEPDMRRGNDEREDRYPYGGDRDHAWRDQGDGSYEHGVERWRGTDRGTEQRHMGGRDYERERYGTARSLADRTDDRGWGREAGDWDGGYSRGGSPRREHDWDERHLSGRGYGRWQGAARDEEDYTGRGPKGYRRSDERIRDEISDRLTDAPSVDASEITVQVRDGEVTLAGSVTTREQKRRAEDIADTVSGVRDVTNSLRVDRNPPGSPPSTPPGTPIGTEIMTAGDRQQPSASSRQR